MLEFVCCCLLLSVSCTQTHVVMSVVIGVRVVDDSILTSGGVAHARWPPSPGGGHSVLSGVSKFALPHLSTCFSVKLS